MSVPVEIKVLRDAYTSDHQVMFSSYVIDRFSLTFEDLKIKTEDLENVIDKIKEVDKNLVRTDFPISAFYDFHILESDNNLITFDSYDNKKRISINYYFNSYTDSKVIFDIIQSFQDKDDEIFVTINSLSLDEQRKIKNIENKKVKSDFNYNSLAYYPYIDTVEMFKQYMISDSNILLLCGTPGTGKTRLGDCFMKYLLDESEDDITLSNAKTKKISLDEDDIYMSETNKGVKVAYIKNEEILATDELWNILKEDEYNLVFLDDLDYSLLPRTQQISSSEDIQKNKFISNLLSFTDGIFESGNKTKFIITSNRPVENIDTAVLRKGRTFDILELRKLKNEEAKNIWLSNGLDEELFYKEIGRDKEVLQADLGTTISMIIKAKAKNIEVKPYIKENGISLYSKVKNPKKIGL